jgi:hypothetical protein
MTYTSDEGRRELLEATMEAAEAVGVALASLGAAYELVDERTADRLEEDLFGPMQAAYGRAKRGHASFAARHGLPAHAFPPTPAPSATAGGASGLLQHAIDEAQRADDILSELQDSLLPVEVGDQELRAALADVRSRLAELPPRAAALLRTLGR